MNSPLLLAAIAFFAVIIIGTALVALNDWLETMSTASATGGSGHRRQSSSASVRRVRTTGFATGRARDSVEVFANAVNAGNFNAGNLNAGNLVIKSARTGSHVRKPGSLGWRA